MVGRICIEGLKLLGIFYGSELGDVERAIGIKFHAQHVIDSDERDHGAEQVRPLGEGRAHQQSAIAPPDDGEAGGRTIFLID